MEYRDRIHHDVKVIILNRGTPVDKKVTGAFTRSFALVIDFDEFSTTGSRGNLGGLSEWFRTIFYRLFPILADSLGPDPTFGNRQEFYLAE